MPSDLSALPRSSAVPIDLRRFSATRKLAADYAHDFARLERFYAGDPTDRAAWSKAIERVRAHRRAEAATRISQITSAQLRARNAPQAAIAAAERLADPRTVAVVTGQQAGAFGGPLFCLLKAVTAVRLAARCARDHGVVTVPVFWVHAEDHDWAEIGSCPVLGPDLDVRSVTVAPPAGAGERPVSELRLDDAITASLESLTASLPQSEFLDEVTRLLQSAYRPGRSLPEALAFVMDKMLGDRGLVVFEASDAAAKPLASAIFSSEIESQGDAGRLAAAAGAELVAAGYHQQVSPGRDSLALFYLSGARRSIHREGDDFLIAGESTRRSGASMVEEARTHPERFSPNVLLRPVVQDTLFPTVAYVAGPSELAYLGQLRPVFERFQTPMPLIQPRISVTLIDSATAKFLNRYDLPFESLQSQDDGVLNQLLAKELPASVDRALDVARSSIDEQMASLIDAVPAIDPTLEGAARSTLGRMQHELQTLRGKIIQAAKRRDDTLRRQFTRARALTFPGGHPQERAVGWISFYDRYGPALVERLMDEPPLDFGQHWLITV